MHQPEIYTTLPVKCFLQLPRCAPKVQVLGRNVAGRSWQSQKAHHKTHNLQLEIYSDAIPCASSCRKNAEEKLCCHPHGKNTKIPTSVLCLLSLPSVPFVPGSPQESPACWPTTDHHEGQKSLPLLAECKENSGMCTSNFTIYSTSGPLLCISVCQNPTIMK